MEIGVNRRIEWSATSGRKTRVVVTEDVGRSPLMAYLAAQAASNLSPYYAAMMMSAQNSIGLTAYAQQNALPHFCGCSFYNNALGGLL